MIYAKIKSLHEAEIAPKVYNNISNFTESPELMKEYGFRPTQIVYDTSTGEVCYFPASKIINRNKYTDERRIDDNQYFDEITRKWKYPLDYLKNQRKQYIRDRADIEAKAVRQAYSELEISTFAKQEKGAKDLLENINSNSDEANLVRELAEARRIDLSTLANKILKNVKEAYYFSVQLLGKQQKLEDSIDNCTTEEEIQSIDW